jgi:hypothetical protein
MQRPIDIYANTLSRRDLARRRARIRGWPWLLRPGWWVAGLLATAVIAERVLT